jgi:ATP-dependent exoDNAse (exonuclease V) beta subunit
VTFTNKAANEMKERLVKLGDDISAQEFSDETGTSNNSKSNEDFDDFINAMKSNKTSKNFSLDPRKLKRI